MRKNMERGVLNLRWMRWLLLGACCLLLVAAVPIAIAQTRADYDLFPGDRAPASRTPLGTCPGELPIDVLPPSS